MPPRPIKCLLIVKDITSKHIKIMTSINIQCPLCTSQPMILRYVNPGFVLLLFYFGHIYTLNLFQPNPTLILKIVSPFQVYTS